MIETEGRMYQDLTKILVTREEIAAKVDELGKKITADYQGKAPVLICILKGGAVFFTDLARAIDLPLTMEFMAISSYGSATKTSGVVRVVKDLDNDILNKDVIIVEDIVDSAGRGLHPHRDTAGQTGAAAGEGPEGGLQLLQHSG